MIWKLYYRTISAGQSPFFQEERIAAECGHRSRRSSLSFVTLRKTDEFSYRECASHVGTGIVVCVTYPEFDAFMAREYGFKVYFELEKNISDHMMRRRLRVVTTVSLNFVMQVICNQILGGAELEYEVIQGKCLNRYSMYWEIVPPVLKDKFQFSGMIRLQPIDEQRCLMIREGTILIDISVGSLILESIVATKYKIMKNRFRQLVEKWKYENS